MIHAPTISDSPLSLTGKVARSRDDAMTMTVRYGLLAVSLIVCSCAAPPASFDRVQTKVLERTGHRVHWNRDSSEGAQIEQEVRMLLGRPLTADRAVQIALLNNRDLQARFEEIGIAQAN